METDWPGLGPRPEPTTDAACLACGQPATNPTTQRGERCCGCGLLRTYRT